MPTLDQAARHLGISEKTLRRWLRLCKPPITPVEHPLDRRYHVITPEELQRVADLRAQLPATQNSPFAPVTHPQPRQAALPRAAGTFPIPTARKARRTPQSDGGGMLPDGAMSKEDASRLHNVPMTTLRRWCDAGRIEVDPGEYGGEGGRFPVKHPLTRAGLAQLYQLASARPDFTRCPSCPHSGKDA